MVRLQREAARDFEMALAANTHHAVAHFNLGSVLYCLGDHGNRLQVRLHFRVRAIFISQVQGNKTAHGLCLSRRSGHVAEHGTCALRFAAGARGHAGQVRVPLPASEKDAKLAQKLGQLHPFLAVFPQYCVGQLGSFGPT
jgi:hypothetical protein